MEILKRMPRTEMMVGAILQKMAEFYQDAAHDEGVPVEVLDRELVRFARFSVRVKFDEPLDFEMALPMDSAEQVRAKFAGYLSSGNIDLLDEADKLINQADRPTSETTAPEPPSEKKSRTSEESGKKASGNE